MEDAGSSPKGGKFAQAWVNWSSALARFTAAQLGSQAKCTYPVFPSSSCMENGRFLIQHD